MHLHNVDGKSHRHSGRLSVSVIASDGGVVSVLASNYIPTRLRGFIAGCGVKVKICRRLAPQIHQYHALFRPPFCRNLPWLSFPAKVAEVCHV